MVHSVNCRTMIWTLNTAFIVVRFKRSSRILHTTMLSKHIYHTLCVPIEKRFCIQPDFFPIPIKRLCIRVPLLRDRIPDPNSPFTTLRTLSKTSEDSSHRDPNIDKYHRERTIYHRKRISGARHRAVPSHPSDSQRTASREITRKHEAQG